MGIHDRDYYRESTGSLFNSWSRQGTTVWLTVVTCVVFFLEVFTAPTRGRSIAIFESPLCVYGCYDAERILAGEVWRLITPVFLHADLFHLAFNMIVFFLIGTRLEELYGTREFLCFYLLAGIFASLATLAVEAAGLSPLRHGVGASGAVMAAMILFAFHFPYQKIYVYFVLPLPMWLCAILYVAINVLGVIGVGDKGIGYLAHLGGAAFGCAYYLTGWRISPLIPEFARHEHVPARRATPRLRVLPAEPEADLDTDEPVGAAVDAPDRPPTRDEHFEARVDAVLEKVSKHGQDSLSPEERALLFQASERYKNRRK